MDFEGTWASKKGAAAATRRQHVGLACIRKAAVGKTIRSSGLERGKQGSCRQPSFQSIECKTEAIYTPGTAQPSWPRSMAQLKILWNLGEEIFNNWNYRLRKELSEYEAFHQMVKAKLAERIFNFQPRWDQKVAETEMWLRPELRL